MHAKKHHARRTNTFVFAHTVFPKKEGKLLLSVALFNQDGEEEEKLLFFGKMERQARLKSGEIKCCPPGI